MENLNLIYIERLTKYIPKAVKKVVIRIMKLFVKLFQNF